MKAKSIASILRRKFNEFAASITDQAVKKLVEDNSIITGGAIASMFLNEKVSDYDIYFTDHRTTLAVAKYYAALFTPGEQGGQVEVSNEDGRVSIFGSGLGPSNLTRMDKEDVEDMGAQESVESATNDGQFRVLFLSENAITLSDQIQIVIRFYGPADEIHKNYDFVHCTNYWTSKDGKLVTRPEAIECLLTKELRYVGSRYPLCSIIRTRKFIHRGWRINAGQYLKMALQLNELDLFDLSVLRDQLVGVDSAHFMSLIESINEGSPEKINAEYICEIINRIF